ncbi:MFS family permease [Arthrobacter silviterrae]|uniref:MFS transporter n=1 Tax=Arthrobacter silviterrae TaxID=2026658 RepID=UPI001F0EE4C9|nr:MFS transporter [Arthrobacter silviterrae]MDQ0279359.1 MFS family permease [Arthrobacter silviterrae]
MPSHLASAVAPKAPKGSRNSGNSGSSGSSKKSNAAQLPESGKAAPKRTSLVVTILCLAGTVVALQQTMVVPLLPDFPKILNTSADNAAWLVTVTLLTSAVATPIVSRMADMFGKRRMMVVAMVTMVIGSVIAAVGGTFLMLLIGRGFQGLAASLIPVGISIMRDELPREKVVSAVALMSATLGIGSALGLPLSGLIYESLGWQAIFWISAAIGVLLIIAVLAIVPESAVRTKGKFDGVGAVLLSAALTSLLLAISKGGEWGWTSEPVILLFIGTVVFLAVWFPWELRVSQPMVDLRTSARKPVLLTNIASILVGFSMYANMLSTTQQLQLPSVGGYGFGLSVVVAGLCMIPSGLAMVALAPVSAAITKRYGAKITLIAGSLVLAVSYVARVFLTGEVWMVILGATVVSMGTAIAYAAMPTLIMRSVPITETASANGLNSLLRAVGTSTMSAVVGAVLTSAVVHVGPLALPTEDAFKEVFWYAAIAALLSIGVSVFIPRVLAAPGLSGGASSGVHDADSRTGALPLVTANRLTASRLTASEHAADRAPADTKDEIVVSGSVVGDSGKPIRQAVVNALHTTGEPADWSRADNYGRYSLVLPESGSYLIISSADGWAPSSQVLNFSNSSSTQDLRLVLRLTLSGRIDDGGRTLDGALVTLTKTTGEFVISTFSDQSGRYEVPLPPAGRYILTALDPAGLNSESVQVVLAARTAVVDLELAGAAQVHA